MEQLAGNNWLGRQTSPVVPVTATAGALTLDLSMGNNFFHGLTANTVLGFNLPTLVKGHDASLEIEQSGVFTFAFPGCMLFNNNLVPTVTPTAGNYARLFMSVAEAQSAAVTMTIAAPAVVSWAAHPLANTDRVCFTSTGALPTGLVAGQWYYVVSAAAGVFGVSATKGGAAITTSGTQSGVHTCYFVRVEAAMLENLG